MKIIHKLPVLLVLLLVACSAPKKLNVKTDLPSGLSEADQQKFDTYFYEGIKLKEADKYDQALEAFRMCLSIDSLDAGALSEAGMLYGAAGMNEAALACLEKSYIQDQGNWWYGSRLVSVYTQLRMVDKAISLAEKLQKKFPNKEEVYNMLVNLYKQTKQNEKAIATLDQLESISGIDQSVSLEKFQLYIQLNKFNKGIAEIDKLVRKFPTESRYKVLRGDIFLQQNMLDKAYEVYQKVLVEDPDNPYLYVSLSEYYNAKDDSVKAMESIVKALKNEQLGVDEKIDVLGQYVMKLVRDSARLNETESLFKMLVDRYPLEEKVHGYYAVYLQLRKRNADAVSELETMVNINPKNEQTWMQLIQIHLSDKNYTTLLDVTGRAIQNMSEYPLWYLYRAITQSQLEKYNDALETARKAIPLIKDNQQALKSDMFAQIGDIHFKLNERDSAFVAYESALLSNPQNIMVMNNYAYYLSLEKKNLKKAENLSAKTVEKEPKNSTYLDTYAWIFYQEGNLSLARFYIERAVDNLPKNDESGVILEHYGDILWKSGNESKALEMWNKSYDAGNKTDDLKKKIENKGIKKD